MSKTDLRVLLTCQNPTWDNLPWQTLKGLGSCCMTSLPWSRQTCLQSSHPWINWSPLPRAQSGTRLDCHWSRLPKTNTESGSISDSTPPIDEYQLQDIFSSASQVNARLNFGCITILKTHTFLLSMKGMRLRNGHIQSLAITETGSQRTNWWQVISGCSNRYRVISGSSSPLTNSYHDQHQDTRATSAILDGGLHNPCQGGD